LYGSSPRTLFQQRLTNVLKRDKQYSDIFEDILKLYHLSTLEKMNIDPTEANNTSISILLEVFSFLGPEKFAKLISIIKGRFVKFPTEEEFQDSIVTSLCYYYKEVENKTWDEIRDILDMPNLNTIKFGIRVTQFKQFIVTKMLTPLRKVEE